MLKITDLVKQYPTGQKALHGVSLVVDQPHVVAIIGPSGAGKSTLIRCVNRLVEPTSGSIELDGIEITKLSRRALRGARRRMGMIFQEYNLVERLTVMENLLSGRLGYGGFWRTYTRRYPADDVRAATNCSTGSAWTAMKTPGQMRCPAASANVSASAGRSCNAQICYLSTNRPPVWIPRPRARSCVFWSSWLMNAARRRC